MGWLTSDRAAGSRALEVALQELIECRKERAELLRALAEARDRGDRIANTLIEAKGGTPVPFSPSPSPRSTDPFEEDASMAEEIRTLITEQGVGAAWHGRHE